MTKREILYIILSFGGTTFVVLVLILLVVLLDKPDQTVVWKKAETTQEVKTRKRSKWEGRRKRAISLVKKVEVIPPPEKRKGRSRKKDAAEPTTIGALINKKFVEDTFHIAKDKSVGWEAKYLKDSYYFVSYRLKDELVNVGPTWLVDVKRKKVLPKNAMAKAVTKADKNAKDFFEREQRVVSAIVNNQFSSGVNLGGVMLIHFNNTSKGKSDKILGWTVVHEYGSIYRAFFQWIDDGELTYAEFEFDYANKALRAVNLQGANLMQEGNDFQSTKRVGIMPTTYDASAKRASDRWTGASRKPCLDRKYRDQCNALASILQDRELIQALEWLLTQQSGKAADFDSCKKARRCAWKPERLPDGKYRIQYRYNLDKTGAPANAQQVSWLVDVKKKKIEPQDKLSDMAYRAVHPRTGLNTSPEG